MRKNFGPKPWLYPMPLLIIGTYDEAGVQDAMNAINHDYVTWGEKVGDAFSIGKKMN